jgi:5,10-methylene-tetrahydrofolate dehydrogenase/methenyl tetrahydrofolate cyclohydrolase
VYVRNKELACENAGIASRVIRLPANSLSKCNRVGARRRSGRKFDDL